MKRIISAIAVVAIVSSALAFKAKPLAGAYCGNPTATPGCIVHTGVKEVGGNANFHVNAAWDGTQAGCTNNPCTTPLRVVPQN